MWGLCGGWLSGGGAATPHKPPQKSTMWRRSYHITPHKPGRAKKKPPVAPGRTREGAVGRWCGVFQSAGGAGSVSGCCPRSLGSPASGMGTPRGLMGWGLSVRLVEVGNTSGQDSCARSRRVPLLSVHIHLAGDRRGGGEDDGDGVQFFRVRVGDNPAEDAEITPMPTGTAL